MSTAPSSYSHTPRPTHTHTHARTHTHTHTHTHVLATHAGTHTLKSTVTHRRKRRRRNGRELMTENVHEFFLFAFLAETNRFTFLFKVFFTTFLDFFVCFVCVFVCCCFLFRFLFWGFIYKSSHDINLSIHMGCIRVSDTTHSLTLGYLKSL